MKRFLLPILLCMSLCFCGAGCGIVFSPDSTPSGKPGQTSVTETEPQTSKNPLETPSEPPAGHIDERVLGTWFSGSISGGLYDAVTGRYEGASGTGEMYTYNEDGAFVDLIVSKMPIGSYILYITGKYSMQDGMITYYDRMVEDSTDSGKTWRQKKPLDDQTRYYTFESDEQAQYMLVGLEDAQPPFDPLTNAVKYRLAENVS